MPKSSSSSESSAKREASLARIEAAKARAEAAKARAQALSGGHAAGFMNFIREQGVVGLAVGLAIGTAAGATVKTIVEGFITPIVRLLIGTGNKLETAVWHVKVGGREADFAWGAVVSSLITLLATALVIYLIIHFLRFDRLDKKKG